MNLNPSVVNGAEQRRYPALKHVLSLVGGALFSAACIFVFRFCPQLLAADTPAAINPPQQSATPTANSNAASAVDGSHPWFSPAIPMDAANSPSLQSTTTAVTPVIVAPTSTESPSSPLLIPVVGIKASQLTDTYTDARSNGRIHDGIDIMAPSGTKVIAADDGTVVKLFSSNQGGLTVYEFDSTERFIYYYAHLDSYAPGLVEGKQLRRGDPIGLVGSSGNASEAAPHLHFEVSVLGPEKLWWKSTAINPYPLLRGH
ncbi:MAG: peptidoglycan DD-metalloendopeptidase family protein [Desulfocapsa sp.]|nr:peptidoglycan DD-metalloendopeptidase family protein [Desulfocapsa sp.]MCG2744460.1 M23 family metallopeptidase [Desulfobacteraceae bacterium]